MKLRASDTHEADVLVDPSVTDTRIRRVLLFGATMVAVALVATFVFAQLRNESVLRRQLLEQGRAFTKEIVATRQFVAYHGGVYVPETAETTLNPYLAGIPGLKTRVRGDDGLTYVLQNPALVTRRVSEELKTLPGTEVNFHLSSDRPLNPANAADAFEREALKRFEADPALREYSTYESTHGTTWFRYASPLHVEKPCLTCHAAQGYMVGDIRGVIDVNIDAGPLLRDIAAGRAFTILWLLGALATLLVVLYFIVTRLLRSLLRAEARLRDLATLDPLTGLENRRIAMRRLSDEVGRSDRLAEELACVMFDLDHFKEVNDARGHAVGDAVLVATGRALQAAARQYDTVARIGGEEFLVLMPRTSVEDAVAAAERMREGVAEATAAAHGWDGGAVTMSAGVTVHVPGADEGPEALLSGADRALYSAKEAGRDRVCVA